jgi:transposase
MTGCFPQGINSTMQYGANLEALAVSLNTVGMVSINRTHEILSGVFGVPISTGTISAMVKGCAEKMSGTVQTIQDTVMDEPLLHADETGIRVDTKTVWAHTASTDRLTYIAVHENRGKKGMDAIGILSSYTGTVIHDCWASYFRYGAIRHGLCNAHLVRELTAVLENTKQVWAQSLIDLLIIIKLTKEKLILKNRGSTPYFLKKFSLSYDAILKKALKKNPALRHGERQKGRPKRGTTGALVDRLIAHKDKYLLFFTDFSIPFDNNQAERDIRMFKVKQKVSGCFRTMDGAKNFAAIMSFIGTARKHGLSAFQAIKNALNGYQFSFNSLIPTE